MGRFPSSGRSRAVFGNLGTAAGLVLSLVLLTVARNWSGAVEVAGGLPVVAAVEGPDRRIPVDRGGQAIPYIDMEVYSLIEAPQPEVEPRSRRAAAKKAAKVVPPAPRPAN